MPMAGRRVALLFALALASCGRLGYDYRADDGGAADAPGADAGDAGDLPDAPGADASDAGDPLDAAWADALVCPGGTVAVGGDGGFCIEEAQRAALTWLAARDDCQSRGHRLCWDGEWQEACQAAPAGLTGMVGDWEWTGEMVAPGYAALRGELSCHSTAPYPIDDGDHAYRCCLGR
jgi:hypothetical protein